MEDLKERYYTVARRLLLTREGGEASIANATLIKHPYNKAHERDRKAALNALLRRTAQQAAEDNAVSSVITIAVLQRTADPVYRLCGLATTTGISSLMGLAVVKPAPVAPAQQACPIPHARSSKVTVKVLPPAVPVCSQGRRP